VPEPIAGPGETGAETHTAENRDRPGGGRDKLSYPETQQMRLSAHRDQHAGPARQCRGPDHGDAEQDVTDHEQDCRHPIDDYHGVEAFLMERLLRVASPLGLFAEEFDVDTGRHLGNFPQAFSHLALIEAAARIIVAERLSEFS
jgi:hypothetical protein